jgi:L-amino acid N-acyltransferase YncA
VRPGRLTTDINIDTLENVGGAPAEPPHLPAIDEQVRSRAAETSPPVDGRVDVQVLTPAEWRPLRTVRLRALQDSPHAFAATYQDEARWSEAEWRSTFDASVWLVARAGRSLIGLARSTPGEHAWQRNVESVWVHPDRRGRGVTRLMLQTLIDHEPPGVTELYAWVLDGNDAARNAYQRLGFVLTGERQPLPGSAGRRIEERLVLRIAGPVSPKAVS